MSEKLLTVKNLKTYFYMASGTVKAVDGVSFSLNRGEVMGIVGESGSGKSVTSFSLIRLLANGTGRIVDGEINFDGRDVLALNKQELLEFRGKEVSIIFQDPMTSLDPVFKIGDQMIEMIRAHRKEISVDEAREMSINSLKLVGIPNPESRINSYPYELSGGMCQRVIIAMAICCKPKMIIADEPTTALDVTVQSQVLKLLKNLQQDNDTAILLITHNLGVVWKMCDSVMVMYAGRTVEYAPVKELYSEPMHPYTWGLLDSMPKLSDDKKEKLITIKGTPPDLRLTGKCCNFYNRCPYAIDICSEKPPELIELKANHFVACHRQTADTKLIRGDVNVYE